MQPKQQILYDHFAWQEAHFQSIAAEQLEKLMLWEVALLLTMHGLEDRGSGLWV